MPEIGQVVKAPEIGQQGKWKKLIWAACESCGKERWVALLNGKPRARKCTECYQESLRVIKNDEELVHLYCEEKLPAGKVAQQFGIGRKSVTNRLRKLGVIRTPKEISKLAVRHGRDHHLWKGGKITVDGYVAVKQPDHHRADGQGYVREHILVWEKVHNKQLPDDWVIHHINGIKNDNRPRNLLAMPKGKHHSGLLLEQVQQRIRELEVEVRYLQRAFEDSQMIFYISEN